MVGVVPPVLALTLPPLPAAPPLTALARPPLLVATAPEEPVPAGGLPPVTVDARPALLVVPPLPAPAVLFLPVDPPRSELPVLPPFSTSSEPSSGLGGVRSAQAFARPRKSRNRANDKGRFMGSPSVARGPELPKISAHEKLQ